MWRAERQGRRLLGTRAKSLFLVIGEEALAWVPRSRAGKPCGGWQQLAMTETTLEGVCQALAELMPSVPLRDIRVVVADRWLAQAVLPWHATASADDSHQQWVRQGLLACGHRPAADDVLRWDRAAPDTPRLCVAYPAPLLLAVQQCAQRLGAPLRSVLPLSTLAWHGLHRHKSSARALLVATRHGWWLACAHPQGAAMRSLVWRLRAATATATPPADEWQGLWQRLVLRDPSLQTVEQVALLDLAGVTLAGAPTAPAWMSLSDAPLHWLANVALRHASALDAIAPRPWSRSPWSWCALTLLLSGAALLVQVQSVRAERDAVAQQAMDMRHALARPAASAPAPAPATPQRIYAVNRAVAQLNLPVGQILRALAPPPDIGVSLMNVEWSQPESDAAEVPIRLVALAVSAGEMVRYAAFLEHQPRLSGLALRQHELVTDGQQWRFVVQLTWHAVS